MLIKKKNDSGIKNRIVMIWTIAVILLIAHVGFADLTDGLVGYWSFDNPGNLGYDDSGTGNHGSPKGSSRQAFR